MYCRIHTFSAALIVPTCRLFPYYDLFSIGRIHTFSAVPLLLLGKQIQSHTCPAVHFEVASPSRGKPNDYSFSCLHRRHWHCRVQGSAGVLSRSRGWRGGGGVTALLPTGSEQHEVLLFGSI